MSERLRVGLDVGATAIKTAVLKGDAGVDSGYVIHHGDPDRAIKDFFGTLVRAPSEIAVTGSGGRRVAEKLGLFYVDSAAALVAATDEGTKVRHVIDIGGGSLSVVDLDAEGRFSGYRTNSLCAAGTGSFLDEQAVRMGLSRDEMGGEQDVEEPPRIAARCAVFAKSDLIHRQQEGYTIREMWSGLCRGMVQTALTTLFRGRKPDGDVLFVGGVALNREVVRWLRSELGVNIVVPEKPEVYSALGALRAAMNPKVALETSRLSEQEDGDEYPRRQTLELKLSKYPSFSCEKSFVDDGTEVRIHKELVGDAVIGIDIGSTSTKAAVVDRRGEVVADLYRRTSGDPIGATQRLFRTISKTLGSGIGIAGVGTTGSGRKMVGQIVGADLIVNEITAHARGAVATDPDVETIFEIGGQDAKFIALKDGMPHDSNMNYVCAAGTGSFVEEQANKLDFALTDIGDAVMETRPPFSSDRCTVFMEQDVHTLTRKGFSRREVMGSVLYSVVQNYLNRVVGRRPYSRKKICFMGATARNKGLVAAFERLLETPIVVSPYCHVMGAFGVAQTVLADVVEKGGKSTFRGLSIADEKVELKRSECKLCANYCRITHAFIGGSTDEASAPSWGYMCGRDPEDRTVRVNRKLDAFRKRDRIWKDAGHPKDLPKSAPTVGIPRALLFYTYLPLWKRFFSELGVRVITSNPTHDAMIEEATDHISSDYCHPIKLAHGHVRELAMNREVGRIFLPYVVQGEEHDDGFKRSVFCPYNIAFPSIAKISHLGEPEGKPIITAVINFQLGVDIIVSELSREVGMHFNKSPQQIESAWRVALEEQRRFTGDVHQVGRDALAALEASGECGVVILGRPYNVCDLGANLGIPRKIADMEMNVLSVDMLPLDDVEIDERFNNMYWKYGRKILQAATFVAKHPNLHAVFLTNFGCGPDAFIQTYVEKVMEGKPMLMLELDEHSADAGYITRLEAFYDVIKANEDKRTVKHGKMPKLPSGDYRTVWVPMLHPFGSKTLAGAFRNLGIPAKPLPPETPESFALAKQYCRGSECVPAPSTIGAFLSVLNDSDAPEKECLFMPSAKGPCRFGQYNTLQRFILDSAGYTKTRILAWDDSDGAYGHGMKAAKTLYSAIIAGDLLYSARCRMRPYVKDRDAFDAKMGSMLGDVVKAIEDGGDLKSLFQRIASDMYLMGRSREPKPLVGIVGEIYVRLNEFTNQNIVETIEDAGGEAWTAPVSEWFKYLAFLDVMNSKDRKDPFVKKMKVRLKGIYMQQKEEQLTKALFAIIADRIEPPISSTIEAGERFFPRQFDGESLVTVGRAVEFAKRDGVDLIVNCAPFGCMPGTLTSGVFQRIESQLGVPVVSIFFDGETDMKPLVRTYLANVNNQDTRYNNQINHNNQSSITKQVLP